MVDGAGVKRRLATLILPSISSPIAAGETGLESSLSHEKQIYFMDIYCSKHLKNKCTSSYSKNVYIKNELPHSS